MQTRKNRKSGFLLIEVLISIFLVAMTALIFAAALPMSAKTGKMFSNHDQATSLLQHKMDQLRGVGYGRLNFNDLYAAEIVDGGAGNRFTFAKIDKLGEVYIKPTATITVSDFNSRIKKVTITIDWKGSARAQGNGNVTADILIAKI